MKARLRQWLKELDHSTLLDELDLLCRIVPNMLFNVTSEDIKQNECMSQCVLFRFSSFAMVMWPRFRGLLMGLSDFIGLSIKPELVNRRTRPEKALSLMCCQAVGSQLWSEVFFFFSLFQCANSFNGIVYPLAVKAHTQRTARPPSSSKRCVTLWSTWIWFFSLSYWGALYRISLRLVGFLSFLPAIAKSYFGVYYSQHQVTLSRSAAGRVYWPGLFSSAILCYTSCFLFPLFISRFLRK